MDYTSWIIHIIHGITETKRTFLFGPLRAVGKRKQQRTPHLSEPSLCKHARCWPAVAWWIAILFHLVVTKIKWPRSQRFGTAEELWALSRQIRSWTLPEKAPIQVKYSLHAMDVIYYAFDFGYQKYVWIHKLTFWVLFITFSEIVAHNTFLNVDYSVYQRKRIYWLFNYTLF